MGGVTYQRGNRGSVTEVQKLLLLLLLLTKRLTWRLVQKKLQGHVTHKKRRHVRTEKETIHPLEGINP